VTIAAEGGCWLWAALNEKAIPSSESAKRLIANRIKIMTLPALFDVL
jgi:hypothetical protein